MAVFKGASRGFFVKILSSASVAALGLGAFAAPSFAQEAEEADDSGLTEIIVTARKVEENLQEVPVAVTAFSGEDLEKQNIQKVENLANFTPGLRMVQAQSTPTAMTIALRGQVQTDILVTLDPSVGTYVDGVYWARAYGLNGNLLDIKSAQVLKGPQGTLFGRNTTGGAILINSNDPNLDEFGGRLSATYGRFNEFEATAVSNIPIIPGKLALRLAGSRLHRDGYTTNAAPATATTVLVGNTAVARGPFPGSQNGQKYDNRDRWNFRGKLLAQLTDNFSLLFSGEYFDSDETTPARALRLATNAYTASNTTYNVANTSALFVGATNAGLPLLPANFPAILGVGYTRLNADIAAAAAAPSIVLNNERPYATARTYSYGLTAALDTPWGEAKLITGLRKVRTNAGLDLEGSQYAIHFTEGQQEIKQQSIELQTTGKAFDGALDFAAGVFAFHETGFDQSISITVPALNGTTSHFGARIDNDSKGVYGQGSWHITDALTFTGGLRYSVDDKGITSFNNNYVRATGVTICSIQGGNLGNLGSEIVRPVGCAITRRDSFSGWSYTAGLDYKLSDGILVYAKTSKGFRSGGQNLRAPSTVAFLPFKPEIAYSYEIGLKSEFFDRRVRLNLAAYTSDINNIQRSTLIAVAPIPPSTVSGTATILSNAGKARIKGIEAELTALVFPGLTLSATGALTDPKYVSFADLSGDRSFERFTGVAKKQFSLAADYSTEFGEDGKINLHVDYSWRGDSPTADYFFAANPQNAAIVEATTAKALGTVGARASVDFGNFGVAIFGRNLTNERDFVQNLLVAPLGYITGIRNEPRTYGVTGTVKF
ncbi:MAG: TonB-dependent receptor [Sphingomonadaceae bacterium]|nr:TonB-dependent receptor [Sphingomonadaceae bacterium]